MPNWGAVLQQIQNQQQQGDDTPFETVRRHHLQRLADYTDRNSILYSTGWTEGSDSHASHQIQRSDVHGFMEAVSGFDTHEDLDLVIHSPGGSPEAAEQIIDYLRALFENIRIIVPEAAMSSASLMCCAADKVIMGKHSALGPVDPQLSINTGLGRRVVPAHAILDQFDSAREEYHESDDIGPWGPMIPQYGPSLIAECEDAIELSEELAKTWAEEYMFSDANDAENRAAELAKTLASRNEFRSHGRPISVSKAEELGFDVKRLESDQELQDRVLSTFHAATLTHRSLGIVKMIENQKGNNYLVQSADETQGESGGDDA